MPKKEARMKQTLRFLKWTKKNAGWWQFICEMDQENMNTEILQTLIKKLAEDSLYEIIFVLLEVYKNKPFMKSIREMLIKDLIISAWKDRSQKDAVNKIIAYYSGK